MKKVYTLLLLVMFVWGLNVSALKVLVTNFDPLLLTAMRVFIAGIAVLIASGFMKLFRLPTKSELITLSTLTLFNVIGHHIFLALGLTYTSGVNTGLILGASPLITMMLAILILKDRITKLRVIGFILGFIGIIMTSLAGTDSISTISIGDLMIFISMLSQAFSFILISRLNPNFDPRLLTGYMLVLGAIVIFITSLMFESDLSQITHLFSWKFGSIFLFSALIATAFGHMTYNYAIKKVGPAESTVFINLNTIFALAGTALFLGEKVTFSHLAGLIMILIGVLVGSGALEYLIKKKHSRTID